MTLELLSMEYRFQSRYTNTIQLHCWNKLEHIFLSFFIRLFQLSIENVNNFISVFKMSRINICDYVWIAENNNLGYNQHMGIPFLRALHPKTIGIRSTIDRIRFQWVLEIWDRMLDTETNCYWPKLILDLLWMYPKSNLSSDYLYRRSLGMHLDHNLFSG